MRKEWFVIVWTCPRADVLFCVLNQNCSDFSFAVQCSLFVSEVVKYLQGSHLETNFLKVGEFSDFAMEQGRFQGIWPESHCVGNFQILIIT